MGRFGEAVYVPFISQMKVRPGEEEGFPEGIE